MKYILLIGDGMGDVPVDALGGKTPIEAAATPTMDRLAPESEFLTVQTVPEGYPPGSDVANLSLLGYEPETYYTGRAPLEAASMGVDIGADEVAFRCNLVNVSWEGDRLAMIDYSAGHISTEESRQLVEAVQAECGTDIIRLYPGISYRHLLVYKGEVPESLVTVPPHDHMDQDVTGFYDDYKKDEHLFALMTKASEILTRHPVNIEREKRGEKTANCLWLWGEGKRPAMASMLDLYNVEGGMISAVDLLMGLGVLSGLEVVKVEGATGYLDTNYAGKAQAAVDVLKRKDLVVVHIEAPDEAGHQGLAPEKVQAIEDFDQKIVAPIVAAVEQSGEQFRLVVTMDHYTPLHRRTHEDWPVPLFLYDSGKVKNASMLSYSEKNVIESVGRTGLKMSSGADFFRYFMGR